MVLARSLFVCLLIVCQGMHTSLEATLTYIEETSSKTSMQFAQTTYIEETSSKTSMQFVQEDDDEETDVWDGSCECDLAPNNFEDDSSYIEYVLFIVSECDCPSTDPDLTDNELWDGVTCDCSLTPWHFDGDLTLLEYEDYIVTSDCVCIEGEAETGEPEKIEAEDAENKEEDEDCPPGCNDESGSSPSVFLSLDSN